MAIYDIIKMITTVLDICLGFFTANLILVFRKYLRIGFLAKKASLDFNY
jgi:hypothetical protein